MSFNKKEFLWERIVKCFSKSGDILELSEKSSPLPRSYLLDLIDAREKDLDTNARKETFPKH